MRSDPHHTASNLVRKRRAVGSSLISLVIGAGLGLVPTASAADDDDKVSGPVLTAQFENDMFFGNSDRHYTHGSRFTWLTAQDDVPHEVLRWADLLPFYKEQPHARFALSLGQSIFTPEDITRPVPDPTDRPYAGWLYGGFGVVTYGKDGDRRDSLELSLGVVGPWSQAEEVQTTWHGWFGFQEPRGWENQIRNEPGVMLSWDTQDRVLIEDIGETGLEWDVTPNYGVTLGNVMTYANLGGTIRLGSELSNDFGPPRVRPSLPGSGFFQQDDVFTWYAFAGLEGRMVARNIFLDGNSFRDSASVDREWLTGDVQVGFSLGWDNIRFAYTQILRAPEFDGQDEPDIFGSLSLSIRF